MIPEIVLIAAMDTERGIGKDNTLPWHIPSDLRHFRSLTLNHPVIMGRKTFESMGSRPLPSRLNIIVSRTGFSYPGVLASASLKDAIAVLDNSNMFDKVFIIGGSQIYAEALEWQIPTSLCISDLKADWDCDVFMPPFPDCYRMIDVSNPTQPGEPLYEVVWFTKDEAPVQ